MPKIDGLVHEDGDEFAVAFYNSNSGHYECPLDAEDARLTGCSWKYGPLSHMPHFPTRAEAEAKARALWDLGCWGHSPL